MLVAYGLPFFIHTIYFGVSDVIIPSTLEYRAGALRSALDSIVTSTRKSSSLVRFASSDIDEASLLVWDVVSERVPHLLDDLAALNAQLADIEANLYAIHTTARALEDEVRPVVLEVIAEADQRARPSHALPSCRQVAPSLGDEEVGQPTYSAELLSAE